MSASAANENQEGILFTVFSATFNRASLLPRAYKSLRHQTLQAFEWVIVDDGSNDGTDELVRSWEREGALRVRYIGQPHQGKTSAFIQAIHAARGEFLVTLDSDDACLPDALQVLLDRWIEIPVDDRVGFVGVTGLTVNPHGQVNGKRFPLDVMDSTPLEMRYRWRMKGDKWGFQRVAALRDLQLDHLTGMGFVPEGVIWDALGRRYRTRYVNDVLAMCFPSADQLSRADPSAFATGLAYWHRGVLNEDADWFRVAPDEFFRSAAQYSRFAFESGTGPVQQIAALQGSLARALWLVAFPVGLALHFRDIKRRSPLFGKHPHGRGDLPVTRRLDVLMPTAKGMSEAGDARACPRILHVIASLAIGGTERQLVQLIRRSSCPDRHLVAVFDEPGMLASGIPNPPILLGPIGRDVRRLVGNVRTALALRRLVRLRGVDLVHAHLGISEVLATIVPRNIPVVASRRGRNVGFVDRRFLRLVEGIGHRRTDLLLCNSRYLAEYTKAKDLWPPPMEVIYNAVDLERFKPAPMPPEDSPTVVVVANLKHYKGQERFLRAFQAVVQKIPAARALLVGDGPARSEFEALVSELGIGAAVTFAGQVEDTRPYVERAHVAALTSSHEGFPNALLEAMAMGRPVVATRVGGIPELVRDGVDGLLTSFEPQDIATAIVKLLEDEDLRKQMGTEGRCRAERFDWERVVRETEAVYRKVLRLRSGRSSTSDRDRHA